MAAYRRVYDSRHLQADCKKTTISSGTLRSVIEYVLPLPLLIPWRGGVLYRRPVHTPLQRYFVLLLAFTFAK